MITWNYDKKADVMYITFGKRQKDNIDHQVEGGIYLSKSINNKKWCGLTIVDFSKRCNST